MNQDIISIVIQLKFISEKQISCRNIINIEKEIKHYQLKI